MEINVQTLEYYRLSVAQYKRFVAAVEINPSLSSFSVEDIAKLGNIDISDKDVAAVYLRLMLQRKYFVRGKDLFVKSLIKWAKSNTNAPKEKLASILDTLESLNSGTPEASFGNRICISKTFENAEDVTYGVLLHADKDRLERISQIPEAINMLILAPYVAARESIILQFDELLESCGIACYTPKEVEASPVILFGDAGVEEHYEQNNGFWRNLRTQDFNPEKLREQIEDTSADDLLILTIANLFYCLIQADKLDYAAISKLVSVEALNGWGYFTYAANMFAGPHGISNVVRHPEEDSAIVKFFPNVEEPFFISTPQIVQGGRELVFKRDAEGWKVWALR